MGVVGFHVICTTYGFWLPNDERGSGSEIVRKKELLKFGKATFTSSRQSVAGKTYDPHVRKLARESLKYPYVELSGEQAKCVSTAIGDETNEAEIALYAFAILPTHFHFVVGELRYDVRRFAGRLKGAASRRLQDSGLHPLQKYRNANGTFPSPWGRLPWVRYLWNHDDMLRAIDYVENNPVNAGKRRQSWSFVHNYESAVLRTRR